MTWKLTRRQVLVATAAAAACEVPAPAPPPQEPPPVDPQQYDRARTVAFAPAEVPEDLARFTLGVQAGAMRQASALLWVYSAQPGALQLKVWRELPDDAAQVALVKDLEVTGDQNGYLKARVDRLAPATWYRYGFFTRDGSARSALGRFRTAFPDTWREPLTLGASTCTQWNYMPYTALTVTAGEPIDAFVHLGDISYNDGARSVADFRAKWHATLKDPGYRALLTTVGWYPVWDDHEFTNDLDPETESASLIANARASFAETFPVEGDCQPLWRSFRWGQTAEIFILDCRTERRPSTASGPDATYISPEQLAWLTKALPDSPCHFKVVLNSVPITGLNLNYWAIPLDRWQGYPAQREKLLAAIEDVDNVWFLTGDFHMSIVARVEKEGPRRKMWEIAVGPGGQSGNPVAVLLELPENNADRVAAFPPEQFAYALGAIAATTFTFDPKRNAVRVRFLDPKTKEVRYDQWLSQADP